MIAMEDIALMQKTLFLLTFALKARPFFRVSFEESLPETQTFKCIGVAAMIADYEEPRA